MKDISIDDHKAEQYLISENYHDGVIFCEAAIEQEPETLSNYWYLGLILLLQGHETEAQMTWLMTLTDDNQESNLRGLSKILHKEAQRRFMIEDFQISWVIRQHIRQIIPDDIDNLLHLVQLSIHLNSLLDEEENYLTEIVNLLNESNSNYNPDLLTETLAQLMSFAPGNIAVFEFIQAYLTSYFNVDKAIDFVMLESIKLSFFQKRPDLASQFAELCLSLAPNHREVLTQLSLFYQDSEQYSKGIETAKHCYQIVSSIAEKIAASGLIIRGLMTAGSYWEETYQQLKSQEYLVNQLIEQNHVNIDNITNLRLFNSAFFLPYLDDNPCKNRQIQNQISRFAQTNVINEHKDLSHKYTNQNLLKRNFSKSINQKILNIGYVSHCFKKHSVGWLCRWIFKYHNPEKYKIHIYSLNNTSNIDPFTKYYFHDVVFKFENYPLNDLENIWNQIQTDEIDILIDLDSITLDSSCELFAIKSAPIQATWLGWDASGLPSIDYFIADPYVVPESAQDYYSETIWKLPQTYIAVDGFEVDVPTLRREDLDIPSDAVVYLMNQKGYKRHQEHLRLQMKIIKEVANSYLLIKGEADIESSKKFFGRIAEEEGVDFSHIKFLPAVPSEAIHRANLQIADIVLDTYPYNGATTTMETLWMSIPIVTRVGEQFSARNSYTMMINAGITEGIAWSAEEYIEWGVRLGKDEKLRQQISWKLRQGRKTAPLWNAKQFTRDMENAYEQMWQKYMDS